MYIHCIGAIAILDSVKTERVTVHYSYVLCEGHEHLLTDCHTVSLSLEEGNAVLDEATAAGVVCAGTTGPPRYPECLPKEVPTGPSECTSGDVHIMDDGQTLQYCYNDHWTGLCTMTHQEAMVACKQLGYTDYTCAYIYTCMCLNMLIVLYNYLGGLIYHSDESTIRNSSLLKNVSCSGTENSLKECIAHEGDCLTQCPQNIGLKCFGK